MTGDQYCGYSSFIGACNHMRRTFGINLPQIRSTKQDLLKMQKDLKKWCHKNIICSLRGTESRTNCQLVMEKMSTIICHTILCFNLVKPFKDPSNTLSILELFDEAVGNGIYDKCIDDSEWFPIEDPSYYLDVISHIPFLAYKYKTSIICYCVPCREID